MGSDAAAAAAESLELGLELIAPVYQTLVVKVDVETAVGFDQFSEYAHVHQIVTELVAELAAWRAPGTPTPLLLKKDVDEFVLILAGKDVDVLGSASAEFAVRVRERAASHSNPQAHFRLRVGVGAPQQRLCELNRSFSSALLQLHTDRQGDLRFAAHREATGAELLLLDKAAFESFLKFGIAADFPAMFSAYVGALSPGALYSPAILSYLWIDIVLMAARFVHHLGGSAHLVFPEIDEVSTMPGVAENPAALREQTRTICARAIAFRDEQASHRHATIIRRACDYLDQHFATPSLSLNDVAAHISLSPNHFSTIFSGETGVTFKEYLTQLRMDKAKELLRTTALNTGEIYHQVGYSDPHYFSVAFKKATGLSPRQFRALREAGPA
jgi:AraC-like DNA-binding protein